MIDIFPQRWLRGLSPDRCGFWFGVVVPVLVLGWVPDTSGDFGAGSRVLKRQFHRGGSAVSEGVPGVVPVQG